MKNPYSFSARSRAAMVAYILDRKGYCDHYKRYLFSWNVKAHSVNWDHPEGDFELDSSFDKAWSLALQSDRYFEEQAFENAQRMLSEDEWTSYPGDDQGNWKFYFLGRSGGHLCLVSYCDFKLPDSVDDLKEWLEEMPFQSLRKFYRGIVCADSDFTREKASQEVEYHLNWIRHDWEEEIKSDREAESVQIAESMALARPDLYPDGNGLR